MDAVPVYENPYFPQSSCEIHLNGLENTILATLINRVLLDILECMDNPLQVEGNENQVNKEKTELSNQTRLPGAKSEEALSEAGKIQAGTDINDINLNKARILNKVFEDAFNVQGNPLKGITSSLDIPTAKESNYCANEVNLKNPPSQHQLFSAADITNPLYTAESTAKGTAEGSDKGNQGGKDNGKTQLTNATGTELIEIRLRAENISTIASSVE